MSSALSGAGRCCSLTGLSVSVALILLWGQGPETASLLLAEGVILALSLTTAATLLKNLPTRGSHSRLYVGTVGNFVPEAIRWNRKDHRYGNREGRSGPAAVGA